jgi:hypothetical protein
MRAMADAAVSPPELSRPAPPRLPFTPRILAALPAQLVAGLVVGLAVGASDVRDGDLFWSLAWGVTGLAGYTGLVLATLWAARALGRPRDVLGLRRVPVGRTAALVVGSVVAVFVLNALLEPIFHGAERQAEAGGLEPNPFPGGLEATVAAVLAGLVLCVGAPVGEELFFRGLVHGSLRRLGVPVATLLSAAVFAGVHLVPAAFPVLFVVGVILALLYEVTGSLIPGIVVHMLINALAFAGNLAGAGG